MKDASASIRELRLNFKTVKRKVEEHGSIVITDNGVPSYRLTALEVEPSPRPPLPDYYSRLLKQSGCISAADDEAFHAENRGDS